MEAKETTGLQDGMLKFYNEQPTDWKTQRINDTVPYDFRDNLKRRRKPVVVAKSKDTK
jgi:hypothetical protein